MIREALTPNLLPISRLPSPRWLAAVVAASLMTGACKDSPTDLLPQVVASETQPALALGVVLPDPVAWLTGSDGKVTDASALDAWRSSWDLPTSEGRSVREEAYGDLVAAVPAERARPLATEELTALEQALGRARSLPRTALPISVRGGLTRATLAARGAVRAADRGDVTAELTQVLRASDALREVGPEAVARALVDQMELGLRRIQGSNAYSPQEAERLRRLAEGGRQALDEGDWVLAIRRAFYARALLSVH